jgi:peptidoglycan-N-acetylmuramic acid deacetylase
MVEEGLIVGNHSSKHPSMPDVSNDRVISEITDTANYFKEVTGADMPKFFRPPKGEWSERTLYISKALGYKTILWSMAYRDWLVDQQPGRDAAFNYVDTHYHNGAVLLLHAVSKSNTEALDNIIKSLQSKGYRFASLDELPQK